jgi:hypothetical protein
VIKQEYRRFFLKVLAALLILSVYPIVHGALKAYRGSVNGPASEADLFACYEFAECLYMNPLSSFIPVKGYMPMVYSVGADSLIMGNTETGYLEKLPASYKKTPVARDEFSAKADFLPDFPPPDLSQYRKRWLRAVFIGEAGQQYNLYQMDGEIWLVSLRGGRLWSIYRLQKK